MNVGFLDTDTHILQNNKTNILSIILIELNYVTSLFIITHSTGKTIM